MSKKAPKEAFGFLEFMLTKDQQEAYSKAFQSIPVNPASQDVVTASYNISALQAFNKADYSMQYLDTQFGLNVGNALNTAVVNLMAGKGSAADIVTQANAAAACHPSGAELGHGPGRPWSRSQVPDPRPGREVPIVVR